MENDSTDLVIPDPDDPVNPNTGKLRINYISDFDFGSIKNVSSVIVQQAQLVVVIDSTGNVSSYTPSIATEDRRGNDRQGWELRVSQPIPMKDSSNHELKGAMITLSGMHYVNTSDMTPIVNKSELVINSQEQTSENTIKNDKIYSTEIVCELVADPTI